MVFKSYFLTQIQVTKSINIIRIYIQDNYQQSILSDIILSYMKQQQLSKQLKAKHKKSVPFDSIKRYFKQSTSARSPCKQSNPQQIYITHQSNNKLKPKPKSDSKNFCIYPQKLIQDYRAKGTQSASASYQDYHDNNVKFDTKNQRINVRMPNNQNHRNFVRSSKKKVGKGQNNNLKQYFSSCLNDQIQNLKHQNQIPVWISNKNSSYNDSYSQFTEKITSNVINNLSNQLNCNGVSHGKIKVNQIKSLVKKILISEIKKLGIHGLNCIFKAQKQPQQQFSPIKKRTDYRPKNKKNNIIVSTQRQFNYHSVNLQNRKQSQKVKGTSNAKGNENMKLKQQRIYSKRMLQKHEKVSHIAFSKLVSLESVNNSCFNSRSNTQSNQIAEALQTNKKLYQLLNQGNLDIGTREIEEMKKYQSQVYRRENRQKTLQYYDEQLFFDGRQIAYKIQQEQSTKKIVQNLLVNLKMDHDSICSPILNINSVNFNVENTMENGHSNQINTTEKQVIMNQIEVRQKDLVIQTNYKKQSLSVDNSNRLQIKKCLNKNDQDLQSGSSISENSKVPEFNVSSHNQILEKKNQQLINFDQLKMNSLVNCTSQRLLYNLGVQLSNKTILRNQSPQQLLLFIYEYLRKGEVNQQISDQKLQYSSNVIMVQPPQEQFLAAQTAKLDRINQESDTFSMCTSKSSSTAGLFQSRQDELNNVNFQILQSILVKRIKRIQKNRSDEIIKLEQQYNLKKINKRIFEQQKQKVQKWCKLQLAQIKKARTDFNQALIQAKNIISKDIDIDDEPKTIAKKNGMMKCLSDKYLFRGRVNKYNEEYLDLNKKEKNRQNYDEIEDEMQGLRNQNVFERNAQILSSNEDYIPDQQEEDFDAIREVIQKMKQNQRTKEESSNNNEKINNSPLDRLAMHTPEQTYQEDQKQGSEQQIRINSFRNARYQYNQLGKDTNDYYFQDAQTEQGKQTTHFKPLTIRTQLNQNDKIQQHSFKGIISPVSPVRSSHQDKQLLQGLQQEVKQDIVEFIFLDLCVQIFQQSYLQPTFINKIKELMYSIKQESIRSSAKKKGVKCDLKAVKQFLTQLHTFLSQKHAIFLQRLDIPLGPSAEQILKYMHSQDAEQMTPSNDVSIKPIFQNEVFQQFAEKYITTITISPYYSNPEKQKNRTQFLKNSLFIFHKSIFDALNEQLDKKRAFGKQGKPFPWKNCSNFNHIMEQSDRIHRLKQSLSSVYIDASYLCGILADKEDSLFGGKNISQSYIQQIRQDRVGRMMANQLVEGQYRWVFYDDDEAEVMLQLAKIIEQQIFEHQINSIKQFI